MSLGLSVDAARNEFNVLEEHKKSIDITPEQRSQFNWARASQVVGVLLAIAGPAIACLGGANIGVGGALFLTGGALFIRGSKKKDSAIDAIANRNHITTQAQQEAKKNANPTLKAKPEYPRLSDPLNPYPDEFTVQMDALE